MTIQYNNMDLQSNDKWVLCIEKFKKRIIQKCLTISGEIHHKV